MSFPTNPTHGQMYYNALGTKYQWDASRLDTGAWLIMGTSGTLGTEGYIPVFTSSNTIGDSPAYTDGTGITIPSDMTGYNKSLLSVDQMQLSQLEGGAFFGRTGITENQWDVTNIGETWVQRGPVTAWRCVAMSSNGKIQTAGSTDYIHVSYDYGVTWTQKGTGGQTYNDMAMSSDGKIQTSAGYASYIYVSHDYGATWTPKGDSSLSYECVSMSSDGKIQTVVTWPGYIYVSYDYGDTWTQKGEYKNWAGTSMSSDGRIQTIHAGSDYIYVSYDYGDTWTQKGDSSSWFGVSMSSDGKIQTAVTSPGYIYVSYDYGDTWTQKGESHYYTCVAMSSDGKIQSAVDYEGYIYISCDYGDTWTPKGYSKDWYNVAMSSDGKIQTAVSLSAGELYVSYATTLINGNVEVGTIGLKDSTTSKTPDIGVNLYFDGTDVWAKRSDGSASKMTVTWA